MPDSVVLVGWFLNFVVGAACGWAAAGAYTITRWQKQDDARREQEERVVVTDEDRRFLHDLGIEL